MHFAVTTSSCKEENLVILEYNVLDVTCYLHFASLEALLKTVKLLLSYQENPVDFWHYSANANIHALVGP